MKLSLLNPASFWIGLLFFTISSAQSQSLPAEGSNAIFITTSLTDTEAYLAIGKVLTEQSILFSVASDGLLISSQGNSIANNKGVIFTGQLSLQKGVVKLTGSLRELPQADGSKSTKGNLMHAHYQGGTTSLAKAGFSYMDELAKKLKPALRGVIHYKLQKEPMS
ncbi:hypothetical protein [Spirosoma foliorum]|uniref:CHRD domain-containing protein n=1 Tax=Spirosoma foliorum TaxID=2710596 RepID=A0A7G5GYA8_9BACT|nr:hypothetical protein [Spirosoma foliorum]QMW03850.1 hypothetical protein H3H32_02515 [Spirosoma foliorum]